MKPRSPELADVVRLAARRLRSERRLSYHQHGVLNSIERCRTAELGGHVLRCHDCRHQQISYNSCRDRHCPKCQASARMNWTEARTADLLPVTYYHVVFTIPHQFSELALQNKRVLYSVLFKAMADTLKEIAADPKHLGAQIGFLAVLHTWGQNLMHHPHLHCVIPAGGFSADGQRWVSVKKRKRAFFLPVKVLSKVFRGKFIHCLKRARVKGELQFHGEISHLSEACTFENLLDESVRRRWVVYAKKPFGGPQQVLKYLARYTHRVAISNSRILSADEREVSFRWKNYANGSRHETMTLDSVEFLRRFLMHTLPKGFQRIRQFGFLSNRHRSGALADARRLISADSAVAVSGVSAVSGVDPDDLKCCPKCGSRRVRRFDLEMFAAAIHPPHCLNRTPAKEYDTS